MARTLHRAVILFVIVIALLFTCSTTTLAEGWESIDRSELINRSRFIGTGRIGTFGRPDSGWRPARIYVSETIYSGIGEVEQYDLKVAVKDVPGRMKRWYNGQQGVWFILKSGDKYEAINHPACFAAHDGDPSISRPDLHEPTADRP